jgi:hypothetical protein
MNLTKKSLLAALACSALLAACGGGGSSTTNQPNNTNDTNNNTGPCSGKELTYDQHPPAATGNPYTQGQKVCFTGSATSLAFDGKTLTNPIQNTAVTAPYSAYNFVDGTGASTICYETVLNAGALYEINVGKGAGCTAPATFNYQGQFR